MVEQFEYVSRVSHGWVQVRLTLSDTTATIEYDSSTPVRLILQCEHKKLTGFHGVLITQTIEQYETFKNEFGGHGVTENKEFIDIANLIDPYIEDETMNEELRKLNFEYIRLPEPQMCLEQGGFGIFDWTETFTLVLLLDFAGYWYDETEQFKKTPLGGGLENLHAMHFAIAQGRYTVST